MDVCPSCTTDLQPGLERWGLSLEHKRWEQTVGKDPPERVDCLEAMVEFPSAPDARAFFRKEDGFDRLVQFFKRDEPQGGDPLFDRAVFVENGKGEQLRPLLEDEDVQSAIMELVFAGGVQLGEGWARVRRMSKVGIPLLEEEALPLVVLAVHIESWSAAR